MASLTAISSNIIKKRFPIYHYTTSSILSHTSRPPFRGPKSNCPNGHIVYLALGGQKIYRHALDYSTEVPGTSPPEFPRSRTPERYNVPLEVPQTPNVPDFDPIPPEKPADPPPLSPGENPGPGFPGPPSPSPPKPEAPVPPLSPPGQPEVVPPHGPEIMPSQPPDPGPPHPTQPDIPKPV